MTLDERLFLTGKYWREGNTFQQTEEKSLQISFENSRLFGYEQANAANQRAARTTYTIRLDSTQDIAPRICRLPAQVVATRIPVAGDTLST
jgi:hypothetical protein